MSDTSELLNATQFTDSLAVAVAWFYIQLPDELHKALKAEAEKRADIQCVSDQYFVGG